MNARNTPSVRQRRTAAALATVAGVTFASGVAVAAAHKTARSTVHGPSTVQAARPAGTPVLRRPAPNPRAGRSSTRAPIPAASPARTVWDDVADCESSPTGWDAAGEPIPGSADWHLDDGSGYYGGLQFAQSTWDDFGGLAFAVRADLATREQQIEIARRVLVVQGWAAWPVCSRKVGLR